MPPLRGRGNPRGYDMYSVSSGRYNAASLAPDVWSGRVSDSDRNYRRTTSSENCHDYQGTDDSAMVIDDIPGVQSFHSPDGAMALNPNPPPNIQATQYDISGNSRGSTPWGRRAEGNPTSGDQLFSNGSSLHDTNQSAFNPYLPAYPAGRSSQQYSPESTNNHYNESATGLFQAGYGHLNDFTQHSIDPLFPQNFRNITAPLISSSMEPSFQGKGEQAAAQAPEVKTGQITRLQNEVNPGFGHFSGSSSRTSEAFSSNNQSTKSRHTRSAQDMREPYGYMATEESFVHSDQNPQIGSRPVPFLEQLDQTSFIDQRTSQIDPRTNFSFGDGRVAPRSQQLFHTYAEMPLRNIEQQDPFGAQDGTTRRSRATQLDKNMDDSRQDIGAIPGQANQNTSAINSTGMSIPVSSSAYSEDNFIMESGQKLGWDPEPLKARGRTRRLDEETKRHASMVRSIGACWNCKIAKITCSAQGICQKCSNGGPLSTKMPCRELLKDYAPLFLPDIAVQPFERAVIAKLMRKSISFFTQNRISIWISSGASYPPIQLTVYEFCPADPEILSCKVLKYDLKDQSPILDKVCAYPVGLNPEISQNIAEKLSAHIRKIVMGDRNHGEVTWGFTSELSWDVYKAILLFQKVNPKNPLLEDAVQLFAMQFFMTVGLSVSKESQDSIMGQLQRPWQSPYQPSPELQLINLQVKEFMCSLLLTKYEQVLDGLAKELGRLSSGSWVICFCCIMILRMCAEMVQVVTDGRIMTSIGNQDFSESQRDIVGISKLLDDKPIAHTTELFHAIHKMGKSKTEKAGWRGFRNPNVNLSQVGRCGTEQDTETFVRNLREIMEKHGDELEGKSKNPSFENKDSLADHLKFRQGNSGRLVAQFLQTFQ